MIIHNLEVSNISSAFKNRLKKIDFDSLGPGLIAIVGENGSGKTTLLELSGPATFFRTFISYGESVASHVVSDRNAFSRLCFSINSKRYRAVLDFGPTPVAHLYENDQLIAGPLVSDYDRAIKNILPPMELLTASVFAAQGGKGSFFSMSRADRKDLFVSMLGLERLQSLSMIARQRSRSISEQLTVMRSMSSELETTTEHLEQTERKLQDAISTRELATRELAVLEAAYASVQEDLKSIAADMVRVQEKARLLAAYSACKTKLREIEKAVAEKDALTEIVQMSATAIERANELAAKRNELQEKRIEIERELGSVRTEYNLLDSRIKHLEPLASLAPKTLSAEELKHLIDECEAAAPLRVELEIVKRQASLISQLEEPENPLCQRCPLTKDARRAKQRASTVEEMLCDAPEADLQELRSNLAGAEAREELSTIFQKAEELRRILSDKEPLAKSLESEISAITLQMAKTEAQVKAYEEAQRRLAYITAIESTKDAHLCELDNLKARLEEFEGLDEHSVSARNKDLQKQAEKITAQIKHFRDLETRSTGLIGSLRAQIDSMRGEEQKLAELRKSIKQMATDIDQYNLIETALGRNGIQALEIDTAGPDVTAIANELLLSCYGPRFSLSLETVSARKDGEGTKEVFHARIIDALTGGEPKLGSGGEMVILDEAIRLALAIYNSMRCPVPLRTLWRDETTGALSHNNASRYIAMLRRAREISGAHAIIFIAHQEHVWQQADSQIFL